MRLEVIVTIVHMHQSLFIYCRIMLTKRKVSIIGAHSGNKMGEVKMESGNGEEEPPMMGTDYMVAKGRLQGVLKLLTERSDSENSSSMDGDDAFARKQKRQKLLAAGPNKQQHTTNIGGYRHTYVMKLFDRSVDLAKFEEDTPLYPICRAWMTNQPRSAITAGNATTRRPLTSSNSNLWMGASTMGDVYRLPPPQGPPLGRAPSPTPAQRQTTDKLDLNYDADEESLMSKEQLIRAHLKRWVGVKRKWIRTAALHEERYTQSKHILQAIYNRAQDTLLE